MIEDRSSKYRKIDSLGFCRKNEAPPSQIVLKKTKWYDNLTLKVVIHSEYLSQIRS